MESPTYMLDVMKAAKQGSLIEFCARNKWGESRYAPWNNGCRMDWEHFHYRIAKANTNMDDQIAVMEAWKDGAFIESRDRCKVDTAWRDVAPVWNWSDKEYRVKPMPVELWVNEYSRNSRFGSGHLTANEAELASRCNGVRDRQYVRTVHLKEVVDK